MATRDLTKLEPMYASVGDDVPTGPGWTFEPKYDGIRVLAHVSPRRVHLVTRNGRDKVSQFPDIADALAKFAASGRAAGDGRSFVLDGEIVALADGEPARFQELQGRMHVTDQRRLAVLLDAAPAALIAFDVVDDGETLLLDQPWTVRRRRLERLLARKLPPQLRLGDTAEGDGDGMLREARRAGWEGIIAKRTDARYEPGRRSRGWLKLKIEFRQEFVVGGFTEPRNSREHLGTLLLGYYDRDGGFVYAGHGGGGFTRVELDEMRRLLDPLERPTSPFTTTPRANEQVHWVRPKVVVEVKFNEWTTDGKLRQPIFLGVRDDKPAREVTMERESVQRDATTGRKSVTRRARADANVPVGGPPRARKTASKAKRPATKTISRGDATATVVRQLTAIERAGGDGTLDLDDGVQLRVSSLDKPFFPKAGVTKGDLMRYYVRVAPHLLPQLADRPLSLKRYPDGVGGEAFYQQKATDAPAGVRVAHVATPEGRQPRYVGGDLATLLHTVQLGSIAVNPWHSRIGSLDHPDYMVLDFDPGPRAKFDRVLQVARWTRDELAALELDSALKTSGASGVHLVVPLPPKTTYATSAALAERVARAVAEAHPAEATVERSLAARPPASVYVDYLQNARGKTLASVFSVRAEPLATVSAPIAWPRAGARVAIADFTIPAVLRRLRALAGRWEAAMDAVNDPAIIRAAARPPRSTRAKR